MNYPKKEIQIEILKSINDPEIIKLYNSLPTKDKSRIDSVGIRDKYMLLRNLSKQKKAWRFGQASNQYCLRVSLTFDMS